MQQQKRPKLSASLFLLVAIFFADLYVSPAVPVALLYILPLIQCSKGMHRNRFMILTVIASILTLIAWWASYQKAPEWVVFLNRVVTLSIIWIVAALLLHLKKRQQELKKIIKKRTQQLRKTSDSLYLILRSLPDGLLLVDEKGKIHFANEQISNILGHSLQDVLGRSCYEFIKPSQHEKFKNHCNFSLQRSSGPPYQDGEYLSILTQDGSESHAEVALSSVNAWDSSLLLLSIKDASARKIKEDREKVIQKELKHRIANIISLLMSLVRLSAFKEKSVRSFAKNLEKRICAFSRMQDMLRDVDNAKTISLKELICHIIAPFDYEEKSRVNISTPNCAIDHKTARPLYLVLFELASNSAKYGAFSTPLGQLTLKCQIDANLLIEWKEHNISINPECKKQGFGSELIDSVIKDQLNGKIERRFEKDGLKLKVKVPLDESKVFMQGNKNEMNQQNYQAEDLH